MKFSIIIPTYNRANFILKTINSVLNQSYANFEILIVDDGSSDNTKEIISKINDSRVYYYYKENGERGAARNFGVTKATGSYVTFLDSDDLLLYNYFEEAHKYILKQSPSVFFQLFRIENTKGEILQKSIKPPIDISEVLVKKGNIFACQGAFIQKDIALKNPFEEDRHLAGSEDYELWLRLNARYKLKCNPLETSILIEHENRSVLGFSVQQLIKRKEMMLHYLFKNKDVSDFYLKYKSKIESNTYSYISLHILLAGEKKYAKEYLLKAIKSNFLFVFTKRFLAIVKRLFFN